MTIAVQKPSSSALSAAEAQRLREQMACLVIEHVPVVSLHRNPRNAKLHPEHQILMLAENFRNFGMTHPLVIDEDDMIIAGHARIEAVRLLGQETVPVIRIQHLTPQQKRAVALADNKLAELGTWNQEMLAAELTGLLQGTPQIDFDYAITGFDTVEIDQIVDGARLLGKPDPADELPPPADEVAVSERGDVWVCGQHQLYCGNALDAASYRIALGGVRANVVFTTLPHIANPGRAASGDNARKIVMIPGDFSSADFAEAALAQIAGNAGDGAVIYLCGDWRRLPELSAAARPHFGEPRDLIVWVKANAGKGTLYRAQHELILLYVAADSTLTKNLRLGERGRYRTNVWQYPEVDTFGRNRHTALRRHPAVKPVALVVDVLHDCSKRGAVVLDPFAGSGTTMIAAERAGRQARLIEIDPAGRDAIVRRWQNLSGEAARLAQSKETFKQVEDRRRVSPSVQE